MEALRFIPNYAYDDYVGWEGRWELIEGIAVAMSPTPRPKHQWIAANIQSEFRVALKHCKACRVYGPIDYRIGENTVLQPDMLIFCGHIEQPFLDRAPELVVEILSPSTASKDKFYKLNAYQKQGVHYYIIIDVDKESVMVLELREGHYQTAVEGHGFTHSFTFSNGCAASIDFNEIWD